MVTMTDLGFMLSKELQKKKSVSEECTVSQCKTGIPPEQVKTTSTYVWLCFLYIPPQLSQEAMTWVLSPSTPSPFTEGAEAAPGKTLLR